MPKFHTHPGRVQSKLPSGTKRMGSKVSRAQPSAIDGNLYRLDLHHAVIPGYPLDLDGTGLDHITVQRSPDDAPNLLAPVGDRGFKGKRRVCTRLDGLKEGPIARDMIIVIALLGLKAQPTEPPCPPSQAQMAWFCLSSNHLYPFLQLR